MRSTRPWMIKKFAAVFLTWVVTFLTKQAEGSRRSRRLSKTKSRAGPLSSRRRTLVGNEIGRRGLSMSALGHKRTSQHVRAMSALPPKADIAMYSFQISRDEWQLY